MAYRTIGCRVWFDWDFNGVFTEETTNLVRASGERRFAPPYRAIAASQGIVDSCSIELRNTAGRYSALNSSGALYAYVQSGGAYHVPMYVECTTNGSTYTRVFTGVTKIPRETGRTWQDMPTVEFECRSRDELLLQRRASSTHADFKARRDRGDTEADIIRDYLEDQGLTSADYSLDRGMFVLPWAWLDDESPLEDMWQIAAAAGGRLYTDATGDYVYENMAHWLRSPHQTSQATYTNADWQTFEAVYDDGSLYDEVTVEYAGRQVGKPTVLWTPDEVISVPAGGSRKVTAIYGAPAYTTPAVTWKAASLGGTDITSSVSLSAALYAQRAELTFTNAHATVAATITPLEISAQPAEGGPTADETRTSADDGSNSAFFTNRGGRTRSVRGNVYVQSRAQAGTLALFLLHQHERPLLSYRVGGLLANPARIPGDRVTLNDVSVMSSGRAAMVVGVNWDYGGQAYTMDLECIDAANLYPYATTSPSYFVIGGAGTGNQLGSAHANRGRLFY